MNEISQNFTINPLDVTVLIIMVIFGITSYVRGFTAAALTLGAWGGAFIGTGYLAPLAAARVYDVIQPEIMAYGITYAVIFILSLFLLKMIASMVGRIVKNSDIGSLDSALGLLFGLFSGMFVISALYMITTPFISENKMPNWFQEAKSRPLIQYGASMISAMNPYFNDINLEEKRKDLEALERMKKMIPSFPTNDEKNKKDEKYKKENQDKMDELFKKLSNK